MTNILKVVTIKVYTISSVETSPVTLQSDNVVSIAANDSIVLLLLLDAIIFN